MKTPSFLTDSASHKLRREIALALAVKIALVVAIKLIFFSDPPSKTEVATRVAERLVGGAQATTEFQPQRATQELEKP
ncbi:MAG: hypothetical protein PHQ05_10360 [Sterolibacterium sp.]|nr:hypothetical protein [Sterolibacterium sp.]